MIEIIIRHFECHSKFKYHTTYTFRAWSDDKRHGWVTFNVEAVDYATRKRHKFKVKFPKRLQHKAWLPYLVLQKFAADIEGATVDKYKNTKKEQAT